MVLVACKASVAVRIEIDDGFSRLRLGGEGVVLREDARGCGLEAEDARAAGVNAAEEGLGEDTPRRGVCEGEGARVWETAATTEAGDHSATVRATGGLAAARS